MCERQARLRMAVRISNFSESSRRLRASVAVCGSGVSEEIPGKTAEKNLGKCS